MKNKIIKIYLILTIIITTINIYPIYAYDWYQEETIQRLAYESDPSKDPNAWQPIIDNSSSTKYKLTIEKLLGYINVIGIVISVVVVTIIGIKYMLGSVEEKAEYKKTMIGYLIGALLLFSTTTVANILYNIGTSI